MANYTPDGLHWGFRKEKVFRCGNVGGTQSTPVALSATQVLPLDYLEGDMEIPEPQRKKEEFQAIGGGQNTHNLVELGYEAVEKDLEMKFQSGILLYYFLGSCTTDGGVQIPALADTITDVTANNSSTTIILTNSTTFAKNALAGFSIIIDPAGSPSYHRIVSHAATSSSALTLVITPASGATAQGDTVHFMGVAAGTATIKAGSQTTTTLTTTDLGTLAANALVGKRIVTNESGSPEYIICANTASTGAEMVFTLNKALGPAADGKTVTFYTYPFTHTITEANTIPSMILHTEQILTGYNVIRDYLGCLVTKLMITVEKGGYARITPTFKIGKFMTGTEQTSFPSPLPAEIMTWDMVKSTNAVPFAFTYNGSAIEGSALAFLNEADRIEITLEREVDYDNVLGDEFPYKIKYGTRKYIIKIHFTPITNTLYNLKNTKLADYTGNLALTVSFQRTTQDYISMVFSSLYLSDYPNILSNYETRQVGVDFELKNAPAKAPNVTAGTLAVSVLDNLDERYYETDVNAATGY